MDRARAAEELSLIQKVKYDVDLNKVEKKEQRKHHWSECKSTA